MEYPLPILGAALLLSGCNVTAPMLFRGDPPDFTGPQIVLTSEDLEPLDRRGNPLYGLRPFWNLEPTDISACERALWQRTHWSVAHDELPAYALQFAGITVRGRQRVFVSGVCPREWEWMVDRYSEAELRFPRLASYHSGRCGFDAQCDPHSGIVYGFRFSSDLRR